MLILHVSPQAVRTAEPVTAQLALEWLHTSMHHAVANQKVAGGELHLTHLALEWLVPCVEPFMSPQQVLGVALQDSWCFGPKHLLQFSPLFNFHKLFLPNVHDAMVLKVLIGSAIAQPAQAILLVVLILHVSPQAGRAEE